jgi:hypothetical protein
MPLSPDEVRAIAREAATTVAREAALVAAKEAATTAAREASSAVSAEVMRELKEDRDAVRCLVADTVRQTLLQLGISPDQPLEVQKDMQHLRDWRESMALIRSKGILTVFTVGFTGLLAMLWVGFREYMQHFPPPR